MERFYKIQWDESQSTGVPLIDNQHKRLLIRINGLLEAIVQGKSRLEIGTTITFLQNYVEGHFSTEEKMMKQTEYPGEELHKKQHREFRANLEAVKKEFRVHGASDKLALKIERGLIDWYKSHVLTVDKALGSFLKEKHMTVTESLISVMVDEMYDQLDSFMMPGTEEEKMTKLFDIRTTLDKIEARFEQDVKSRSRE
ncbi:bacteriohemerythrin [candidate division KSB1 bacterium]